MNTYNLCNCILILLIILGIYYAFIYTSEENYFYGQFMDAACGDKSSIYYDPKNSFDCSTPEGIEQATKQCQTSILKPYMNDPANYKRIKEACENKDLDIRREGCADICDVSDVSRDIIMGEKGRMMSTTCKQPLELGINRSTGDQWCKNMNNIWTFYKSAKTLESEKKAEEEMKEYYGYY